MEDGTGLELSVRERADDRQETHMRLRQWLCR